MPPDLTPEQKAKAKRRWSRLRAHVRAAKLETQSLHGDRTFHTEERSPQTKMIPQVKEGRADVETPTGPVRTRFGATLARRLDSWTPWAGGPRDTAYAPTAQYMTKEETQAHEKEFEPGGHAWISEWAHENILRGKGKKGFQNDRGGFGAWGLDSNFVGTLGGADDAMEKASEAHGKGEGGEGAGIERLEKAYALKKGDWKSKDNVIYRYRIPRESMGLWQSRMPSGAEAGALRKLWVAGGKTGGGATEAVVNSVSREELKERVKQGHLVIERVHFGPDGKTSTTPVALGDLHREDEDMPATPK